VKDYELKNIDPEDIEDLLMKVETSFDIEFVGEELIHITTFGQLCDHIANKIQLDNSGDCTSQQAFYKLREAISSTFQIDKKSILISHSLADILPRQNRRAGTMELETHLGFKLNILRPPLWVVWTLVILLLASFVGIFFNWQIGFLGLVFSFSGLWISSKIGNKLDVQTVGQLAEKMTRENYLKSRRNPKTFNRNEIEKVLTDWFSEAFDLEKSKLTRDAEWI